VLVDAEAEGVAGWAGLDGEHLVTVWVVVGSTRRLQLASAERHGHPMRFLEVVHM